MTSLEFTGHRAAPQGRRMVGRGVEWWWPARRASGCLVGHQAVAQRPGSGQVAAAWRAGGGHCRWQWQAEVEVAVASVFEFWMKWRRGEEIKGNTQFRICLYSNIGELHLSALHPLYSSVAPHHRWIYVHYIHQWHGTTNEYMGWVKVKPLDLIFMGWVKVKLLDLIFVDVPHIFVGLGTVITRNWLGQFGLRRGRDQDGLWRQSRLSSESGPVRVFLGQIRPCIFIVIRVQFS
jgi:hypothetical protein